MTGGGTLSKRTVLKNNHNSESGRFITPVQASGKLARTWRRTVRGKNARCPRAFRMLLGSIGRVPQLAHRFHLGAGDLLLGDYAAVEMFLQRLACLRSKGLCLKRT